MDYRYEIKIPISKYNKSILTNFLFSLRNLRKDNEDREVNNVYFDTLNYYSAKSNLDGLSYRLKYRARWYEKNHVKSKCNVEFKIKNNKLNSKLVFGTNLHSSEIKKKKFFDLIKRDLYKTKIIDKNLLIQDLFPIVQNRYKRKYFRYNDSIRLTYDTNIKFKNIKTNSINNWYEDHLDVLEIKFDQKKMEEAMKFIHKVPFVPKRHSKYLRGLSLCKIALYI